MTVGKYCTDFKYFKIMPDADMRQRQTIRLWSKLHNEVQNTCCIIKVPKFSKIFGTGSIQLL